MWILLLFVLISSADAQFPPLARKSFETDAQIVLDERKQLFLDEYLVASSRNVRRLIHPVRKYSGNPVVEPGFIYGSVIVDGCKYRMWYQSSSGLAHVAYAESRDGIIWERPDLGLV
jgi:hypothetical protein